MMKKRMYKGIISALVLISALVSFAIFAGAAEANAELGDGDGVPSLEIVANNILYNDRLEIYYALDVKLPEGAEVSDVRMAFWNEPQESYTKDSASKAYTRSYSEVATITVGGVVYENALLVKSNGIDMKSIVDYVYAVAYVTVDGVDYYSEVSRYSVLEYIIDRYYDLDTAPETTSEAVLAKRAAQRKLYDKTLEVGAAAQIVFEYRTDYLANEGYVLIDVDGGDVGQFTKQLYKKGDEVRIAPQGNVEISSWLFEGKVISSEQECVFVATESGTLKAVTGKKTLTVTVEGGTGSGTYEIGDTYTVSAEERDGYIFEKWSNGETATSFTKTVEEGGNVTYTAIYTKIGKADFESSALGGFKSGTYGGVSLTGSTTNKYGGYEIVYDPINPDNKVLRIHEDIVPQEYTGAEGNGSFKIGVSGEGRVTVVEFDLYIESTNGSEVILQLFFGTGSFGGVYQSRIDCSGSNYYFRDVATDSTTNDLGGDFKLGEWVNVRYEYYPISKDNDGEMFNMVLYVNGEPIAVSANPYGAYAESFTTLHIWQMKALAVDMYFDNIEAYRTDSASLTVPEDVTKYYEADSESAWNARYNVVIRQYGEEVAEAIDHLTTSLFNEDIYHWIASLYDPKTGGIYFSNSARDNFGYLPDLESTGQASGVLGSINVGSWSTLLTDYQKAKMATWVMQMQSNRDGYLYHPQWETDIGDGRRGRDLSKLTSTPSLAGYSAFYDHPYARLGDKSESYKGCATKLTYTVTASAALLVSKVVYSAVDESLPAHLRSEEAYRAYLENLWSGNTSSNNNYYYGSTITSQSGQIKAAGLDAVTIEVLNARQQAVQDALIAKGESPNGLWEENVTYHAISGLLKISGIYNTFGYEIPYGKEALASAIEMMRAPADEYAASGQSIVSVYNPLNATRNVLKNVNLYGIPSDRDGAIAILKENALEIVKTTEAKIALYRKEDGSFSYGINNSSSTSQGEPSAVPGSNEGDVNGTSLALGARTALLSCLELSDIQILPTHEGSATYDFGDGRGEVATTHAEIFKHLMANAVTVEKGFASVDSTGGGYDFEDGIAPGGSYDGINTVKVVDDPDTEGNKLLYVHDGNADSGVYVNFASDVRDGEGQFYYLFSADMVFESVTKGTPIQIIVGNHFMLQFSVADDRLGFEGRDASGSSLETYARPIRIDPKQWFNIEIRVYPCGVKYGEVIYYSKLTVTQNEVTRTEYYKNFANLGNITSGINRVTVYSLKGPTPEYYLDNVVAAQYGVTADYGIYDFDKVDSTPIGVDGGEMVVGRDNALRVSDDTVSFVTKPSYNAAFNFDELQMNLRFENPEAEDGGRVELFDRNGKKIIVVTFVIEGEYTVFRMANGQELLRILAAPEEDMTLRMEYHYDRITSGKLVPTFDFSVRYLDRNKGLYDAKAVTVSYVTVAEVGAVAADYQSFAVTAVSSSLVIDDVFARRATSVSDRNGDGYYFERDGVGYGVVEDVYVPIGDYDFETDSFDGISSNGINCTIADGKLTIQQENYGTLAFMQGAYDPDKVYADGTRYVFEADFTYLGGKPVKSGASAAFMGFMTTNEYSTNKAMLYNYIAYGKSTDADGNATTVTWSGVTFEIGVTYRVRFEYTVGSELFEIYVDGVKASSVKALTPGTSSVKNKLFGFGIEVRSKVNGGSDFKLSLDNVNIYTE